MLGQPCPHGDPHCPCNNDTLACNYEDLPGSPRSRCPRTGLKHCTCVASYPTYERGWCERCSDYTFFCEHGSAA